MSPLEQGQSLRGSAEEHEPDVMDAIAQVAEKPVPRAALITALRGLLDHVDSITCTHQETHRGGFIWTCDDCGRKWGDDGGGFKPHEDDPAVAAARELLLDYAAEPLFEPAQAAEGRIAKEHAILLAAMNDLYLGEPLDEHGNRDENGLRWYPEIEYLKKRAAKAFEDLRNA